VWTERSFSERKSWGKSSYHWSLNNILVIQFISFSHRLLIRGWPYRALNLVV